MILITYDLISIHIVEAAHEGETGPRPPIRRHGGSERTTQIGERATEERRRRGRQGKRSTAASGSSGQRR